MPKATGTPKPRKPRARPAPRIKAEPQGNVVHVTQGGSVRLEGEAAHYGR